MLCAAIQCSNPVSQVAAVRNGAALAVGRLSAAPARANTGGYYGSTERHTNPKLAQIGVHEPRPGGWCAAWGSRCNRRSSVWGSSARRGLLAKRMHLNIHSAHQKVQCLAYALWTLQV